MQEQRMIVPLDWFEEVLRLGGLGAIGGIARYLQLNYLQTRVFEFGAFLSTMVVGSVCGIALGWAVGSLAPTWQNVTAIVSGVVGLQIVYVMASLAAKITGRQFGVEITELELKNDTAFEIAAKRKAQDLHLNAPPGAVDPPSETRNNGK